jgi:hypothetical protein
MIHQGSVYNQEILVGKRPSFPNTINGSSDMNQLSFLISSLPNDTIVTVTGYYLEVLLDGHPRL